MRGKPIDVSSTLADGTVVDGMAGVKQLLLSDPERFVGRGDRETADVRLGRNVQYFDAPAVREIVRDAAAKRLQVFVAGAGRDKSAPFQMRSSEDRRERTRGGRTHDVHHQEGTVAENVSEGLWAHSLALPMLDSMIPALSRRLPCRPRVWDSSTFRTA